MNATFAELYPRVTGREMPTTLSVRESDADVIRPGRGFIGAFDFTMQVQVGCPGGCLYCYVPASKWLTPADMRRKWGFEVRNKRRAAEKLQQHLDDGVLADRTVYWSGVTDPYAAPPHVTRSIWEVLSRTPHAKRPRRIAVQSRFAVERDAALIAAYCDSTRPADGGPAVVVSYSIGSDRTDVIRRWERATPSFERRMATVRKLRERGLFVVVTLSPFGPWRDLSGTLRTFQELGVPYLTVLFFKREDHCAPTPRGFLDHLASDWPDLLDAGWQAERLREIESVYGRGRVLEEQAGFSSLIAPHGVGSERSS